MNTKQLILFIILIAVINQTTIKAQVAEASAQNNVNEELFEAVDAGNLEKVQELIEANPTLLNTKDKNGNTPLIRACFNKITFVKQPAIAKYLIEKGADINIENNQRTALYLACAGREADYDLARQIISAGANVNVQGYNGITPLHMAALYLDLKLAKLLIENGADVNINDKYNGPIGPSHITGSVLKAAVISWKNGDKAEMVKYLLENGAKLNRKDDNNNTELHHAVLKGDADLVRLLAKHGADINSVNKYNRTALYYAAKQGYGSVANELIEAGADKNSIVETNYGKPIQLTETLKEGEAWLWQMGNNFAVKTMKNLILFTFGGKIDKSPEAGLANGRINPDELSDQKITMLLNHFNRGRLMGAEEFIKMSKLSPDINLVSSFNPDFSDVSNDEIPTYSFADPNKSFSVGEVKVHTIPALAHGLGYLVESDGIKIFYAGLHVSDSVAANIEKFRKEIDFLKPFGPVDIVMLTVHSHSNVIGYDYKQYLYLLDELSPKVIYLMGANIKASYPECAEVLKVRNIPIIYPELTEVSSDMYHYQRNDR